jgi:glucose/arabinose dehydrogenase
MLWIADRDGLESGRLSGVAGNVGRGLGRAPGAITLPDGTTPSSIAFYHGDRIRAFQGNLLVASDEGRHLLRLQMDPAEPTRVVATERLLQDRIGGIRLVGVAPTGVIHVATTHALGMLVPVDR